MSEVEWTPVYDQPSEMVLERCVRGPWEGLVTLDRYAWVTGKVRHRECNVRDVFYERARWTKEAVSLMRGQVQEAIEKLPLTDERTQDRCYGIRLLMDLTVENDSEYCFEVFESEVTVTNIEDGPCFVPALVTPGLMETEEILDFVLVKFSEMLPAWTAEAVEATKARCRSVWPVGVNVEVGHG